jgi:hypothetical protein
MMMHNVSVCYFQSCDFSFRVMSVVFDPVLCLLMSDRHWFGHIMSKVLSKANPVENHRH